MIELDFNKIFPPDFVASYTNTMLGKISPFNLNFYGVNISVSRDDLSYLLFDPFFKKSTSSFISDYYKIANFLLHSKKYFDYLKKSWSRKGLSRKERKRKLCDERHAIIGSLNLSILNRYPPVNICNFIESDKAYYSFYNNISSFFDILNKEIDKCINYNFIDGDMRSHIIRTINIKVCPYCNRQYVGYYNFDKKQKNVASLDHFYPQTKFPLYSVSLLNLVPSCAYCNGMVKKDRLYPMKHIYTEQVENKTYFRLNPSSLGGILGENENFELLTSEQEHDNLKSFFFRHKELYSIHSDDISLWLKKKRLHNEGYRKHLSSILNEKITEEALKMMLFENTGSEFDVNNRPLGKLKKDILKL